MSQSPCARVCVCSGLHTLQRKRALAHVDLKLDDLASTLANLEHNRLAADRLEVAEGRVDILLLVREG